MLSAIINAKFKDLIELFSLLINKIKLLADSFFLLYHKKSCSLQNTLIIE
jgi:hypothetical protein